MLDFVLIFWDNGGIGGPNEVRAAIEQVDQVRARLKLTRRVGAPAAAPPMEPTRMIVHVNGWARSAR